MKTLYFAYGANLNLASMKHRCPDARPIRAAELNGYRLVFSGVASIVPATDCRVPGALWEITEACEKSLDIFEGWPALYRKEYINFGNDLVMVYVINDHRLYQPSMSYFLTIAQGYQDWNLDLAALIQAAKESHDDLYTPYDDQPYSGILESPVPSEPMGSFRFADDTPMARDYEVLRRYL